MLANLHGALSVAVHTEKLQPNKFTHFATQLLSVKATRLKQVNQLKPAGCQGEGLAELLGERDGGRGAIWGIASRAGRHVAQHWDF